MTPDDELQLEAEAFAVRLTETVIGVAGPSCSPWRATVVGSPSGGVLVVRQEPATGVVLHVDGEPLLTLVADYRCAWDHEQRYLAVLSSAIKVYPGPKASREPLLRYEFVRKPTSDIAGAHLQVHGHRDALTYVMTRAGRGTPRGRARAERLATGSEVPAMQQLHLPLGGSRFRPCLEDVLEFLVQELGVDAEDGWQEALAQGRERWRRVQIGAALRDAPSEGVRVLQELGYTVTWPGDKPEPPDRQDRLREL